jgi:hypothetical protein
MTSCRIIATVALDTIYAFDDIVTFVIPFE